MITARGILIEAFSVLQNIAMSFTLDVDPIDPRVVPQAGALARDVGIDRELFDLPAGKAGARHADARAPGARARARAEAVDRRASVGGAAARHASPRLAPTWRSVAQARGLALIAITADDALAKAIGGQRLELVPATGELRARRAC